MPNNGNISVRKTIEKHLNNPDSKPLTSNPDNMRKDLASSTVIKQIYDEFRNPPIKKGGKKNKRKSNKRKSNKRKSNKRKSNKRKYTIRRK
jgi:hypothetical protein